MILAAIQALFYQALLNPTFLVHYLEAHEKWEIEMDARQYNYSLYAVKWKNITGRDEDYHGDDTIIWNGSAIPVGGYVTVKVNLPCGLRGLYLFEMTPAKTEDGGNCEVECKTFSHREVLPYPELKCKEETLCGKNWTAEARLTTYPTQGKITAEFIVKPCQCVMELKVHFELYERLNNSNKMFCNETDKNNFILHQMENITSRNCNFIEEKSVDAGSYCLKVYIYHGSCVSRSCSFGTAVQPFYNATKDVLLVQGPDEAVWYIYVICGFLGIVCVVSLIIGIYCIRKKKVTVGRNPWQSTQDIKLEDLIQKADDIMKKLEVVLLYIREFEEHIEVVESLCDFLLNAWKVATVKCDFKNAPGIGLSEASWTESITRSRCNRHIMIVESEGAVLQEEAKRNAGVLRPVNEDYLDSIFPRAMELLKQDTRSLCDYKEMSVVKFEYSPGHMRMIGFLPNRRYVLPDHLFQLYCDLLELPAPNVSIDTINLFEEEMNKRWENEKESRLMPRIKTAMRKIAEDPELVRNSFRIEDPVSPAETSLETQSNEDKSLCTIC